MKENENVDLLDILLLAANQVLGDTKDDKPLTEVDLFGLDDDEDEEAPAESTVKNSVVHTGDTDSSDDEGNRNYEDKKYNDCGTEIKHLLTSSSANSPASGSKVKQRTSYWKKPESSIKASVQSNSWKKYPASVKPPQVLQEKVDVYTDPIFGIRIINPLISSSMLQDRMVGREAISFDRMSMFSQGKTKEKDWALAGVIVSKSPVKTSQKGTQFSIWTLSDLKDGIKTVGLFLFSSAHSQLWKTSVGTVVGVLNANVLDRRDGSKDEASLSIDTHQKVMILGQSKDFGLCKSTKKNGEKCTAIVNKNRCEYCLYHIKQEYQKCSQRSELQSNFGGGGLTALRNKVLGKNEVFYAGKSYMAIPARKSRRMDKLDTNRLNSLSGKIDKSNGAMAMPKVGPKKRLAASQLDVSRAQRMKDLELLKKLGGSMEIENKTEFSGNQSTNITLDESKNIALSVINKLKAKKNGVEQIQTSENKIQIPNSSGLAAKESESRAPVTDSEIGKLKDGLGNDGSVDINLYDDLIGVEEEFAEFESFDYDDDSIAGSEQKSPKNNCSESFIRKVLLETAEVNSSGKALPTKTPTENALPETSDLKIPCESLLTKTPSEEVPAGRAVPTKKLLIKKVVHAAPEVKNGSKDLSTLPDTPGEKSDGKSSSTKKYSLETAEVKNSGTALFTTPSKKAAPETLEAKNPGKAKVLIKKASPDTPQAKMYVKPTFLGSPALGVPKLSGPEPGKKIDLSTPAAWRNHSAKLKAIKVIQKTGPIKKIDPNNVRGTGGKKRPVEELSEIGPAAKKSKLAQSDLISDRFKKMMTMGSKHADLLEARDDEAKEKYFGKLEIKEQMEEKMAGTFKMACKAVRCVKCKYTGLSALDSCKRDKHPLRVFDAVKRFFECGNCGNRIVSLVVVPTGACTNCGGRQWKRTGMVKEKVVTGVHCLSIRGGEQKFANSVVGDANLNLMVPDD